MLRDADVVPLGGEMGGGPCQAWGVVDDRPVHLPRLPLSGVSSD